MKFLALFAALLLEQSRPLKQGNSVYRAFERYSTVLERQLNGGQFFHGFTAWMLAVVPFALLASLIHHVLDAWSPVLGWIWSVAVLYLAMGFRQLSHDFRDIAYALKAGDAAAAREHLSRWRGVSGYELTPNEIARVSIELALLGAHRHMFGPLIGFIVLGPAGAVVYRLSAMLAQSWQARPEAGSDAFGLFAQRFFFWYDWVPARLTAASFAIVGNFEDAVYCWRTQAAAWSGAEHGILLASGGGALGVRLGDPIHQDGGIQFRPELGLGDEADVDYMHSASGLVWRALVLWMFLVFIVTVAHSLG